MTSIFGQTIVPKAGVEEALPVWMKIDWRPEIEKGIYIDWGKYYSRRGRVNHALTYLNKASELAPEEVMILYNRSKNLRRIGKSHSALQNCKTARKILKSSLGPQSYPINLETCDALYELNRFEDAKAEAHNSANLFSSNKTQAFEDRLLVIDENIRDCCGDGLTPFILKNQNIITHVQDLENNKMKIDERPLWKILKEEGKCDVLSIPEIKSQQLSPREIARRRRAYDICNQYYLDKSWKDIHSAIYDIDRNPNVLMPQCRNSHKFLETLIKQQYKIVQKFAKMIHSRSPMYYMRYNKHADKTLSDKFMEDQLSRIQYQTRRNMVSVLRTIRRLREEQNISKLSKYVEEVMGEYVVLKTFRIMPWKFEFINEVYNTLALALAEQYYVPSNFKFNERKAFHHLLHLETDKIKDTPQFVFGDRSTYQDITAMDLSGIKSRRQISNLENRMIFAKYSIEKCYLLHQIANIHLDSNRYEECGFTARKAIEESKNCNSLLWSFLCTILIVKSNASLNKFERAKEALKNAMQIATDLDCHNLAEFVEMSFSCLERISIKGSLSNPSSHRGSKSSVGSTNSM